MAHLTKIAVIGVGLIGPRHAQTVIDDGHAVLSAIVDPMLGEDLAKALDVAHYKSVADLVTSTDKPDGAIICTPNHTHVTVGLELIRAGVHILVEKPISIDLETGRTLVRAGEKAGVKILVGHHRRFNSYIIAAREIIKAGRIGDLVAINGLWTTYKPLDYFDPPAEWRKDKTGGVILINLIHEVDLLHHLLGPIIKVYAEPMPSRRGFEAEEGAAITLRFQSGAVGTFLVSDNVPSPHSFEAGTGENPLIPQTGKDFYRILGSDGALSVPDLEIWSYKDSASKSWHSDMKKESVSVEVETPFRLQLAHFVKVIRGEEEPNCSGAFGLAALAVCGALKESIETGQPVTIAAPV